MITTQVALFVAAEVACHVAPRIPSIEPAPLIVAGAHELARGRSLVDSGLYSGDLAVASSDPISTRPKTPRPVHVDARSVDENARTLVRAGCNAGLDASAVGRS